MKKKYEIKNVTDVIRAMADIAEENTAIATQLFKARGKKDPAARAHREKAMFTILILKELDLISMRRYWAMLENVDEKYSEEKIIENVKEWRRRNHEQSEREARETPSEDSESMGKPLLNEEEKCFICPHCKDKLTYQGNYRTIKYCMLCGGEFDWGEVIMDFEMLEYGDRVELKNGDTCVYVRRELDTSGGIISQELLLIDVFTGDEHSISLYNDDLTHSTDPNLSIERFSN